MVAATALGSAGFSGGVGEGRACPSWVMVLFAEAGGGRPLQPDKGKRKMPISDPERTFCSVKI